MDMKPKTTGTVAAGTANELSVCLLHSDSPTRPSMVGVHGEDDEVVAILSIDQADALAKHFATAAGLARAFDCDRAYAAAGYRR